MFVISAGYEIVPPHLEQSVTASAVRLRGLSQAPLSGSAGQMKQRPVSIIKATSTHEQEKNKECLRNLDHLEVR